MTLSQTLTSMWSRWMSDISELHLGEAIAISLTLLVVLGFLKLLWRDL